MLLSKYYWDSLWAVLLTWGHLHKGGLDVRTQRVWPGYKSSKNILFPSLCTAAPALKNRFFGGEGRLYTGYLFPYYVCCELHLICLGNEHPWWNMILWSTPLPSTWPKVYSKISLHKAMMLMFLQELIWTGEICYTNIVVSWLILKMRSEDTVLEKWCISLPFYLVTLAIKSDHEATEHFVFNRGPSTKDSVKYCYLLTFGKPSMLIGTEVYSIVTYLLSEN